MYGPTMTDGADNQHSSFDDPGLDLLRIEFPSDRLTVRQVREREPDLDGPHPDFGPSYRRNAESVEPVNYPSLQWVLTWERHVARLAYDIAIGKGPALGKWLAWEMTPREIDEQLGAAYGAYRMADTADAAAQLIRGIKEQARTQARLRQAKGPESGPSR